MEDADKLMERIRMRDIGAFETLYDQSHRLVYGVALRVLNDAAAAEDITQSVFLKLWTSPQLYKGGNFPAWIVRVARNRALDLLRSKAFSVTDKIPDAPTENDALEELAIAHVNADRVREALAQLPPEQREPIELGFFAGITHEEIAHRAGAPLGTVKTRIRAGLRKLRFSLGEVAHT